jgi:hypothetical protein
VSGAPEPGCYPRVMLPTDIPTAVKPNELAALQMPAGGQTVLECGALYGASTVALAQVAAMVHSVDRHHGDEQAGEVETLSSYLDNVRRYGAAGRVVTIVRPLRGRAAMPPGLVASTGASWTGCTTARLSTGTCG